MASQHNGSGYFNVTEDDHLTEEHFRAKLATKDGHVTYARTSYLGFIKRTELTQTDGGRIISTMQKDIIVDSKESRKNRGSP